MDERQHLYSEAIYRINSELQSIAELSRPIFNDEKTQFVPCSFDRRIRCFRWLSVHKDNWKWNQRLLKECNGALKGLLGEKSRQARTQTESMARLGARWNEALRLDSIGNWIFPDELLAGWTAIRDREDAEGFDPDLKYHRSLLDLVAGRAIDPDHYIEGLVFNLIKTAVNRHKRVEYVFSELLPEYLSPKLNLFPPVRYRCYYYGRLKDDERERGYYSQYDGKFFTDFEESKLRAHFDKTSRHVQDDPDKWKDDLQRAMMRLAEDPKKWFLSVPIYDGGSAQDPWGRLVGIVHTIVSKETSPENNKAIAKHINRHSDRLLVAFRATARAQIAAAPVVRDNNHAPGLVMQQFLHLLPSFQDWERVSVSYGAEREAITCWTRHQKSEADGFFAHWTKCDGLEDCGSCPTRSVLTGGSVPEPNKIMTLKEDLSVLIQMPWVGERELTEIANLRFAFELPVYAAIPKDSCGPIPEASETWKRLRRQYLHEQIDVLRLLVPKVQAHRHAVRTAAVAIMSRNMSHNLGSHVLSAVATNHFADAVLHRDSLADSQEEQADPHTELLHYLQERMDFIAEVATAGTFMSVPSSFERMIFAFRGQTLLQKTITGTGELASVEKVGNDFFFASPGGRHGSHAFYVIFENLLRNTAKHGAHISQGDDTPILSLYARIEEADDYDDLLRVRVWDDKSNGRQIRPDGSELFTYINDEIKRQSMIDGRGRLQEGSWGIKELMIAGAYLRQIALEELESPIAGPPLLRVLVVDNDGYETPGPETSQQNLCYEFFVRRAKTALIACTAFQSHLDDISLRKSGIDIITTFADQKLEIDHSYLVCEGLPVQPTRTGAEPNDAAGGVTKRVPNLLDAKEIVDLPVRRIRAGNEGASATDIVPVASITKLRRAMRPPISLIGYEIWRQTAEAWKVYICTRHGVQHARLYHGTEAREESCGDRAKLDDQVSSAVIYDKHSRLLETWGIESIKMTLFWEGYGKIYDQFDLFETPSENRGLNYKRDSRRKALEAEFLTAGIARIVILDERVQEAIEGHKGILVGAHHIEMREAVERRRIYVPNRIDCDLKIRPDRESIQCYLQQIWAHGEIDFIVIHQGILDRLRPSESHPNKALNWIKDLVRDQIGSSTSALNTELVVCSGRGIPSEVLRSGVRFVPLSAVLRWAIHKPSKYHLYELLCASRRSRRA